MKNFRNKTKSIVLLLCCCILKLNAISQRCATMDIFNNSLKSNPHLITIHDSINEVIKAKATEIKSNKAQVLIRIPVVVHLIGNNVISSIAPNNYQRVHQQIDILNEDFRKMLGSNGDGNGVDTEIEFCLASRDEYNGVTNGINEVDGVLGPYGYVDDATIKALIHWDPTKYLNLYVIEFSDGLLGYATFPTDLVTNPELDGVVIGSDYFGISGHASYGFGRTTTHEVGHWLNLHHTWGDDLIANCGDDDGVNDTPICLGDNGIGEVANGCLPPNECAAENALAGFPNDIRQVENYMDYSDDLCMNIFTQGQTDVMQATLSTIRDIITGMAVTKCDGTVSMPHCANGYQDYDELGIDCGGFDCLPCLPNFHCSNGYRDYDEMGVDCGGLDCPPCTFATHCYNFVQDYDETGIDCGGLDCLPCMSIVTCSYDDPYPIHVFADIDPYGVCGWWTEYPGIVCLNPFVLHTGGYHSVGASSISVGNYLAREYSRTDLDATKYIEFKPLAGCSNSFIEFKKGSRMEARIYGFACSVSQAFSAYTDHCYSNKTEEGVYLPQNTTTTPSVGVNVYGIRVYPNPTIDNLYVSTNTEYSFNSIEIRDLLGIKHIAVDCILSSKQAKTVDVSTLYPGAYIITFGFGTDRAISTIFVKQ